MPLEQDPKQANSCTNKCHQTLKGKQIDHKSAPFVNDKIAKNPVLIGPGEHHAGTKRGQGGDRRGSFYRKQGGRKVKGMGRHAGSGGVTVKSC